MLELFSPAKINLFLRIVSKRGDGYHNLSSVFQTVSLGDRLTLEPHSEDILTCSDPTLPIDRNNLVLKATECFRKKTGLKHYFKIYLQKRIPVEAGLGGGSSNAATVLWGCNQLAGTKLPMKTLRDWGAEIGSDVPFFFSHGTAHCTGRGESVYHLPALPSRSMWIVKPPFGIPTSDVYGRLQQTSSVSEVLLQRDLNDFLAGDLPYFNDLEPPAFELKPELQKVKNDLLEAGFHTVLMSGSGSSFFCLGEGKLPLDPNLLIFPVEFINRSLDKWYPLVSS